MYSFRFYLSFFKGEGGGVLSNSYKLKLAGTQLAVLMLSFFKKRLVK